MHRQASGLLLAMELAKHDPVFEVFKFPSGEKVIISVWVTALATAMGVIKVKVQRIIIFFIIVTFLVDNLCFLVKK